MTWHGRPASRYCLYVERQARHAMPLMVIAHPLKPLDNAAPSMNPRCLVAALAHKACHVFVCLIYLAYWPQVAIPLWEPLMLPLLSRTSLFGAHSMRRHLATAWPSVPGSRLQSSNGNGALEIFLRGF